MIKYFMLILLLGLFTLAFGACGGNDDENIVNLSEEDRSFIERENPSDFHELFSDYTWVVFVDNVGYFFSDSEPQTTLDTGGSGGYICMEGLVAHDAFRRNNNGHKVFPYGHCVGSGGKNHFNVYPQQPIN